MRAKYLWCGIGIVTSIYIYALPIFLSPLTARPVQAGAVAHEGVGRALCFSALLAFTCSFLAPLSGFLMAVALVKAKNWQVRMLPFLMLPALLGSASYAFILRRLGELSSIQSESLREREPLITFLVLSAAQSLRFFPLAAFTFWTQLRGVQREQRDLLVFAKATAGEQMRYVFWPAVGNLYRLLVIIVFALSYAEYGLPHLLLKASRGTGSETISASVWRYYQVTSRFDPEMAREGVLILGAIVAPIGAILALAAMRVVMIVSDWIIGRLSVIQALRFRGLRTNILRLLLVMPFLPLLALARPCPKPWLPASEVLSQAGRDLVIAFFCSSVAVLAMFHARMAFPQQLAKFAKHATWILGGLFLWLAVPPTAIALTTHWWLARLGAQGNSLSFLLLWGIAEVTLTFPLIGGFVLAVHLGVSSEELYFLQLGRARCVEVLRNSFVSRFWPTYLLMGFFSFSLIWHESTINAVLGAVGIGGESLPVLLEGRIDGRSGSFGEGNWLILSSLIILSAGCLLWATIVDKGWRQRASTRQEY